MSCQLKSPKSSGSRPRAIRLADEDDGEPVADGTTELAGVWERKAAGPDDSTEVPSDDEVEASEGPAVDASTSCDEVENEQEGEEPAELTGVSGCVTTSRSARRQVVRILVKNMAQSVCRMTRRTMRLGLTA